MGRIPNRNKIGIVGTILSIGIIMGVCGCGAKTEIKDAWLEKAQLDAQETPEELYEKALKEDILVVYSVSTRVTQTKDAFESTYPGLSVEVKDMRSPTLIDKVVENYESGNSDCDIVICNDNSGDFKERVSDKGIAVPYIPYDIKPKMIDVMDSQMGTFSNEAEILFYNGKLFDKCPIENIWELTDEKYKGKIYMPNPLHSFSTYALCGASFENSGLLEKSYKDYYGEELKVSGKASAAEVFWSLVAENVVFTNSSDEVMEAIGNGDAFLGFMVTSKMRYRKLGYTMEPVYKLNPFCGCRTSVSVMIAKNSKNINTAKLFIRFLLGETDGDGEGYKPFALEGTWPVREDAPNGTDTPLDEIDLLVPNQDYLIKNRGTFEDFWMEILGRT